MRMGVAVGDHDDAHVNTPAHGFSLFAGKAISAFDNNKREHVIRYMARPPIPINSLSWTDDGHVLLKLKRAWSNGTSHMKFTGPEFIERLVSLVPPPRVNSVRYHGVLAPNARLRATIVRDQGSTDETEPKKKRGRYLAWAELMQRVFEFDVTNCPKCGAAGMQVIACITESDVIRRILRCIGQPAAPPQLEPATDIDHDQVDFDAA